MRQDITSFNSIKSNPNVSNVTFLGQWNKILNVIISNHHKA